MRNTALIILISFQAVLFTLPVQADQARQPRVVFLSPDTSRFWDMVGGFMQAVAADLEIDFSIHTDPDRNRFSYQRLLEKVLAQPEKPDYIVLMCKEKVTHEMLTMIGDAGVRAFTFNTDVPEDELSLTGQPREKMAHWIGHVSPDNQSAGARLADELHQRFQRQNGTDADMLVGLSGGRDSSAAIDRNLGLSQILEKQGSMTSQVLFANWDEAEAAAKVERLIDRYPNLDLIWSASDGMALGAISAVEDKGLNPGDDILIGGVDWESRALEQIDQGNLSLSLGRHFMGGGLTLLLIRDYHEGHDFADHGPVSMNYSLTVADRDNLTAVREVMNPNSWSETDFRRFSRHYNESLRIQPVSASGILDNFMGALSPGFR